MHEEEQSAVFGDLAGEGGVVGVVAEDDVGADPDGMEAPAHFMPGDEETACVHAAPLEAEIGPSVQAVIGQHDEIESGLLQSG